MFTIKNSPLELDTTNMDGGNRNRHKHEKRGRFSGPKKAQILMMTQRNGHLRTVIIPDPTMETSQKLREITADLPQVLTDIKDIPKSRYSENLTVEAGLEKMKELEEKETLEQMRKQFETDILKTLSRYKHIKSNKTNYFDILVFSDFIPILEFLTRNKRNKSNKANFIALLELTSRIKRNKSNKANFIAILELLSRIIEKK